MSRYFDAPERIDVSDDLRDLVAALASDCAGAIQIHAPRHARYYDTDDTIHPRALNKVANAGGHFVAVEQLPAPEPDRDDLTWHGSDCNPAEEVATFEFYARAQNGE